MLFILFPVFFVYSIPSSESPEIFTTDRPALISSRYKYKRRVNRGSIAIQRVSHMMISSHRLRTEIIKCARHQIALWWLGLCMHKCSMAIIYHRIVFLKQLWLWLCGSNLLSWRGIILDWTRYVLNGWVGLVMLEKLLVLCITLIFQTTKVVHGFQTQSYFHI